MCIVKVALREIFDWVWMIGVYYNFKVFGRRELLFGMEKVLGGVSDCCENSSS